MQMTPFSLHEPNPLITGPQRHFVQAVYHLILAGALYHGSYGLWALIRDYISSRTFRIGLGSLLTLVTLFWVWVGIKKILVI